MCGEYVWETDRCLLYHTFLNGYDILMLKCLFLYHVHVITIASLGICHEKRGQECRALNSRDWYLHATALHASSELYVRREGGGFCS